MRFRFLKPLAAAAAGTTLILAAPAGAAGAAPAAPAAPGVAGDASAKELCGPRYQVVNRHHLIEDGALRATIFLSYDKHARTSCVVTLRTAPGAARPMAAYAERSGSPRVSDTGSFRHYAGPVRVSAEDGCMRWGGSYQDIHWNGQDPATERVRASCPSTG